jgi:hypothetical protein
LDALDGDKKKKVIQEAVYHGMGSKVRNQTLT